jgi:hypothetical protein
LASTPSYGQGLSSYSKSGKPMQMLEHVDLQLIWQSVKNHDIKRTSEFEGVRHVNEARTARGERTTNPLLTKLPHGTQRKFISFGSRGRSTVENYEQVRAS